MPEVCASQVARLQNLLALWSERLAREDEGDGVKPGLRVGQGATFPTESREELGDE
jgi:hypothetical protein